MSDEKKRSFVSISQIGFALDKYDELYHAINKMMAALGAEGDIDNQHSTVDEVMTKLFEIDGGTYKEDFTASDIKGNEL